MKEVTDKIGRVAILREALDALEKGDEKKSHRLLSEAYNGNFGDAEAAIYQEVDDFVRITDDEFTARMCYDVLQLPTDALGKKRMQKTAYQKLYRMKEAGVLESVGYGKFRKIQSTKEIMDWWNAPEDDIPIKLPFGLSQYQFIFPDNMIGIAGVSDMGKTAFVYRTIKDNIDNKELWDYYEKSYQKEPLFELLDTDTSPQEARRRIRSIMNGDEDLFRKCVTVVPRNENFKDILDPNLITFIDYIQLHDAYYQVSGILEELYNKLRGEKGICFYCLQKDPDKLMGMGGWKGVYKSRLYITIDMGRMTVMKAKNVRNENIKGWFCEFELNDGHTFNITRDLKPEMFEASTGRRVT